jgi:hypothetical protein
MLWIGVCSLGLHRRSQQLGERIPPLSSVSSRHSSCMHRDARTYERPFSSLHQLPSTTTVLPHPDLRARDGAGVPGDPLLIHIPRRVAGRCSQQDTRTHPPDVGLLRAGAGRRTRDCCRMLCCTLLEMPVAARSDEVVVVVVEAAAAAATACFLRAAGIIGSNLTLRVAAATPLPPPEAAAAFPAPSLPDEGRESDFFFVVVLAAAAPPAARASPTVPSAPPSSFTVTPVCRAASICAPPSAPGTQPVPCTTRACGKHPPCLCPAPAASGRSSARVERPNA